VRPAKKITDGTPLTVRMIHTCGQQTPPQVTYFSLVLETLEFFSGELFVYKQNPFGFLLLTVMTVKEKKSDFFKTATLGDGLAWIAPGLLHAEYSIFLGRTFL
jgi:hypothetical protein